MSLTAPIEYRCHAKRVKLRRMPKKLIVDVASTVKAILHCSRDCLRNRKMNTLAMRFDCNDGYYGEAFGIMRGLCIQGYGYFGPVNLSAVDQKRSHQPEANLRWWMSELEYAVLIEEGWETDHVCLHCTGRYRKDDRYIMEILKRQELAEDLTKAVRGLDGQGMDHNSR